MEELTRRCRRIVRVAEVKAVNSVRSDPIWTGGQCALHVDVKKTRLFAGLVEVLYARNVWLAVRVDIWMSKGTCYRQVKYSSVYVHENGSDDEHDTLKATHGEAMTALQEVKELELSISDRGETPSLTRDELTGVLEDVVQRLVDAFQAVQVKTLQASASPRAKFEYEMLQHLPEFEVLVGRKKKSGDCYVLFALPLLGEIPQWDPNALLETKDLASVYIPDGFKVPNFAVTTDKLMIFIGYPIDKDEEAASEELWPLAIQWPARMRLSSQVVYLPSSSKMTSSVELLACCQKMFLHQWKMRKDFIAELRRYVIVLEYDAVDFSHVFFMLQEQVNAQAPLRLIILRLELTPAFFLTNCTSDLQVTLLSGEDEALPTVIALPASSSPSNSAASVAHFLEVTQTSLLDHIYPQ